ncbi:LysE/ArgO family amino acid transporter [Megasphaera sp.]|uniref:LysE/ArgO family amino acid transporter n=1 Tax=Megasphaera sp. TaxID=2023260 RepID=UPI0035221141
MFFFQGLTMGLAYVAPIGMQNLFVIHSALSHSLRRAIVTAFIVIFFDISLSLSCFYGIGTLLDHVTWLQAVILGVGTLLVLYIAYGMIRDIPDPISLKDQPASLRQTMSKACIVTWMNPQAILDGTMLLGAFRVTLPAAESTPFLTGVLLASCLWFLSLTGCVAAFRHAMTPRILRAINVLCGTVLMLYGLHLGYTFVQFFQI